MIEHDWLIGRYEQSHQVNQDLFYNRFHEAYRNAVVMSCHDKLHISTGPNNQTFSKVQTLPFYVESVSKLTPLSYFPERPYTDYKDYYQKRYDVDIACDHQPLLEVSKESSKLLTFLTPK